MKVLAGVNGTQSSCDALKFAARLLSPENDSFTFYFTPQQVTVEHSERILPNVPMELRQALVESVFSLSREALPPDFRGTTSTVLGEKRASEGLLLAADQEKADLILVGADDKGRFPFYLGRVAKAVSRNADVPVLVYRKSEWEKPGPLTVMLAHDGGDNATYAGKQLDRFTWAEGSRGMMVRVVEWLDLSHQSAFYGASSVWREEYEKQAAELVNTTKKRLRDVQQSLAPIFQHEEPIIADGTRVHAIVELAQKNKADLIVVGSRQLNAVQRLLGSTTESLLHYAPCSVLVVHPREQP